jgi:DNA-binding NarL/FixJ family response regulator
MSDVKPIRVLIVDDHELVRVGLRTVLDRAKSVKVVGEADTVASAVAEAERLKPDVILMDVRLPDGTGVEACREIRATRPGIHVLFLTSYEDDETLLSAFIAGAQGYLLKEVAVTSLIGTIHRVAAGQSVLDHRATERIRTWLQKLTGAAEAPDRSDTLSAQERRVVALVAEGKTNKEIASALDLSERTVKNYLANAFEKLHITRRSQAAALFARTQIGS